MAYSTAVIDHYENPRNVGKLDKNVGTGIVGAHVLRNLLNNFKNKFFFKIIYRLIILNFSNRFSV